MAFITYITAPLKSLDDYDLQHTISMLLHMVSAAANLLIWKQFPSTLHFHSTQLVYSLWCTSCLAFSEVGVICMHVISPRRCYNCQTLSPHPDESLGTFLWVAHKFPLAIIKVLYLLVSDLHSTNLAILISYLL